MQIFFINYEYPPIGGGGGRANECVAREMAALGHSVTVMTSAYGELPSEELRDGYTIRRIPAWRRYQDRSSVVEMATFMLSSCWHALKWARRERPDVVIAFFTIPSGPAAYLVQKIVRIPYIIALCGGDIPGQGAAIPGFMGKQLRFYHAITKGLITHIWRHAYKVVATCQGLKRLAQQSTSRRDLEVIPNGVAESFFAVNRPPRATSSPFIVLTISRLCPQKGIEYLIRGFKHAQARIDRDMQLWIVGDGPHRSFLETVAYEECNLGKQVMFWGWQEAEAIKKFHAKADLFVIASFDEGLSLAVLEGMAAGLPILGTAISGVEELVVPGVNGLLVPSGNAEAIATALIELFHDDEKLSLMGKASCEMAHTYNWRRIAEAYLALARQAT